MQFMILFTRHSDKAASPVNCRSFAPVTCSHR
jgi:hypothetical protein